MARKITARIAVSVLVALSVAERAGTVIPSNAVSLTVVVSAAVRWRDVVARVAVSTLVMVSLAERTRAMARRAALSLPVVLSDALRTWRAPARAAESALAILSVADRVGDPASNIPNLLPRYARTVKRSAALNALGYSRTSAMSPKK